MRNEIVEGILTTKSKQTKHLNHITLRVLNEIMQ